jgi:predicted ArsR family transcriptional regulator
LLETEFRRLTGRSGPGAGRPAKLYRRSPREVEISLPARRYGLAAELFARAMDHAATDVSVDPLRDVAHDEGLARGRRARQASPAGPRGRSRLLRVLSEGGYEPHVDEEGTIRLRNCPFHALVAQHRDLVCGMNLALAKGMVEGLGSGDVEPRLDPQPGWCCVVFRPSDQPPESSPAEH